jgi:hypothetical protein
MTAPRGRSRTSPPLRSKAMPISAKPPEVPPSPLEAARRARAQAKSGEEVASAPAEPRRRELDSRTVAAAAGALVCALLAGVQAWLSSAPSAPPTAAAAKGPAGRPTMVAHGAVAVRAQAPRAQAARGAEHREPRPRARAARANPPLSAPADLPLYPGAVVRLVHDATAEGRDSVQLMASSSAAPSAVAAFYAKQVPGLKVHRLGTSSHPILELAGRHAGRALHITLTQGAVEEGARTIISAVSDGLEP